MDVVRGLDRFEGDERAFRAWSFTIARRRVLDLRRRQTRRRTDPWDPADLAQTGGNGHAEHDAMASLGTSWAVGLIASSLPPDQAQVLLLRVLGDLGAAEVAAIVGKREGTVRVLQHRALRRLAQILQESPVTR
jgi:RNA polymerase sigma-70 factor (ECF subfamily)